MSGSQTLGGLNPSVRLEHGFGSLPEAKCWNRSVGGGYHEPLRRHQHRELDFAAWQDRWKTPEHGLPTRHMGDLLKPKGSEIPRLNLSKSFSDARLPPPATMMLERGVDSLHPELDAGALAGNFHAGKTS